MIPSHREIGSEIRSESLTSSSINQRIDGHRKDCRLAPEFPIKRDGWPKKVALAGLSRLRH